MTAHVYEMMACLSAGGSILLPLGLVCFFMWLGIFERILFFRKLLGQDLSSDTVVLMATSPKIPIPAGDGLVARLLRDFRKHQCQRPGLNPSILEECVLRIRKDLGRRLPMIQVLASVAPLFGLLGTVTGMIATFEVMAISGTGDVRGMASGISEALVTTQCGLMVAIPGIIMAVYLSRQAKNAENRLDQVHAMMMRHIS